MIGHADIRRWKNSARQEDVADIVSYLEGKACADDLVALREQKLLFAVPGRAQRTLIIQAWLNAAERLLKEPDLGWTRNYVVFSGVCASHFSGLTELMRSGLDKLKTLRRADLLELTEELVSELHRGVLSGRHGSIDGIADTDVRGKVEVIEHLAHEYNGLQNDLIWALARAFNEAWKGVPATNIGRPTRRTRRRARQEMLNLMATALDWNNHQFLVDKISYGEWRISELALLPHAPKFTAVFDVVDHRLERAKVLGLRRHLSEQLRKATVGAKTGVPVLEEFAVQTALAFTALHFDNAVSPQQLADWEQKFRREMKILLSGFSKDDDLLVGAGKVEFAIAGHYLVSLLLRCSAMGWQHAATLVAKKQRRKVREGIIPVACLHQIAAKRGWPRAEFERILDQQLIKLPSTNYFSLLKQPHFRMGDDVRSLPGGGFFNWNGAIRSNLLKGGEIAQRFGKLWEDDCADTLREFGWVIIGHGIKIRETGRTFTDIDILAAKEDLLLVIQCKAMGTTADSVYEHWLARTKILQGARQAKEASDWIEQNPAWLNNMLRTKRLSEMPRKLQPLVITSSDIFTGWNPGGIPISGKGNLHSILHGAKVAYQTSDRKVVEEKLHTPEGGMSTEEFIGFLNFPLDWLLAGRSDSFVHRVAETAVSKYSFPELASPIDHRASVSLPGLTISSARA